jgi:hypothetical protein
MRANWADMSVFLFIVLLHMRPAFLIWYIATYGHPLLSVFLVTSIILWSMIFCIIRRLFPCVRSLTLFPRSFTWVSTQFSLTIKAIQCDNGREFDNSTSRAFFLSRCSVAHVLPIHLFTEWEG